MWTQRYSNVACEGLVAYPIVRLRGLLNNGARIGWANVCQADCRPERRTDDNTRHSGGSNVIFMDGHVKWYHSVQAYTNWRDRV